jgi:hypothetical protein
MCGGPTTRSQEIKIYLYRGKNSQPGEMPSQPEMKRSLTLAGPLLNEEEEIMLNFII